MESTRTPWGDFPPVVRNGLSALSREPEYLAAKAGDPKAALNMVYRLMTSEMVSEVRELIGENLNVRIVPIQAQEATGRNKIPLAVAEVLAAHLGVEVEYDICQSNRVFRTGASADHRLVFRPAFEGRVEPGRSYIVVDDTMTMGGTIAELRGYIMSQGGIVPGAAVMAARESAVNLAITQKMLDRIDQKHGAELDKFWQEEFGHGLDKLTQHEAGHLRAAVSLESIRDRIAAARDAPRRSLDEAPARKVDGGDRLQIIGYGSYRATQIKRAEDFYLKASDEFWGATPELPTLRLAIEDRAKEINHPPQQALKAFRTDPAYSDLANEVYTIVSASPIAQAAEKRLLLTQRRLEREFIQRPEDKAKADLDSPGLSYE